MALVIFMVPGTNYYEAVRRTTAGDYVSYQLVSTILSDGSVINKIGVPDAKELVEVTRFAIKIKAGRRK